MRNANNTSSGLKKSLNTSIRKLTSETITICKKSLTYKFYFVFSDKKKRPTPAASLSGSTGKLHGVTSSPDSGSDLEAQSKSTSQGVKGAIGKVYQSIANHKLNGTLPSLNH